MENSIQMDSSSDDEIIDAILSFIKKRKNRTATLRELVMIPKERKSLIQDKLFSYDLVEKLAQQNTGYGDTITISQNGLTILTTNGSYLNYIKQSQALAEKEREKDAVSNSKLMIEIEALKSQIKLNNDTLRKNKYDKALAILSLIISIGALLVAFKGLH